MRLLLAKLCEYACKLESQRHCMVGIFDDIRVHSLPIDHPPFFVCVQIEFDADEAGTDWKMETVFLNPDGKQLFRAELNGTVPLAQQNAIPVKLFAMIGAPAIRLEQAGDYRLDVTVNGRVIGEERIPVFTVSVA
jgi:hypothetical protein